jgi:hypothetical protein
VTYKRPPHSVADGKGASTSSLGRFFNADLRDAWRDFEALNTDDARSAFASHWLGYAAMALNKTWPMVYELGRVVRERGVFKAENGKTFANFEEYWTDRLGQPFAVWGELERTYHFAERAGLLRLPYDEAKAAALAADAKNLPVMADVGNPNRSEAGTFTKRNNVTNGKAAGVGNRADAVVRRIKKAAAKGSEPAKAVLTELENKTGKYKSAAAAGRAAGVVKPKNEEREAVRLLKRLPAPVRIRVVATLDAEPDQATRIVATIAKLSAEDRNDLFDRLRAAYPEVFS